MYATRQWVVSVVPPWYGSPMNEYEMDEMLATTADLGVEMCHLCDTYTRTDSCLACDESACEICGNDVFETQHRTTWVHLPCEYLEA